MHQNFGKNAWFGTNEWVGRDGQVPFFDCKIDPRKLWGFDNSENFLQSQHLDDYAKLVARVIYNMYTVNTNIPLVIDYCNRVESHPPKSLINTIFDRLSNLVMNDEKYSVQRIHIDRDLPAIEDVKPKSIYVRNEVDKE